MFRSPPVPLVLALGSLALTACGEDRTPTQPESGTELAPAAAVASALAPNTWTLKAAPPNGFVNQLSAGVVPDASGQSVVYTLGGRDDDGGSGASILTYRIGTNTWSIKSYEPRVYVYNSNGVGRIGSTLYISGGRSYLGGSDHIDGHFSAYDPATNTLTDKPTPPKLTAEGVTGVIGGKLYVLPGSCSFDYYPNPYYCEQEPFRRLFRYNPSTNLWATKKSAPHYHKLGAGGVINGQFYVAGGEGVAALDRYDPATDTWKTLAPLPVGGWARGAVIQGKLFVVVTNFNQVTFKYEFRAFAYDPATNVWTRKAAPKWDHPEIVPITWGGKPYLLAVGGIHFDPGALPNPTEVYAP
jgi:N-acetylneuraminic acid mutarotase